ncbi:Aldehyde dehydrogenase family 3 member H1 [Vitis vinifera]|uniref:Aldehyde dehydrogenase family 3 member H1 n=1 Tax=Vitis vinifera TaxID=29760 RepID=A0A438KN16_VITVI|nr:Aldehyde dehydrogenase family 3 member H1 [Vitis vinifera]
MEKLRRIPSAKKTKTWKKIKNGKKTGKGSHGCLYIIRDFVGLFNFSKGGKETAYRSHRPLPQKLHIEELSYSTFLRVLSVYADSDSSCCGRKSSMAEDSETKKVFDAEAAASLMKELRGTYASGKTRSYQWRVAQLKNLMKIVDDHEKDILDAIRADLSKPEQESYIAEVWVLCLFELILY